VWGWLLAGATTVAGAASCSATQQRPSFTGGSAATGGTGNGGAIVFEDGGDAAPDHQGPTTCDPSCGAAGGTCKGGTCVLTENPGGLDGATQGKLMAGGTSDPKFAWLYPYDKTVFPQGMLAPTFQFAGSAPDAFFVHIVFPGLDYQGFYAGTNARVAFSQPMWMAITLAALAGVEVKVDVTKISGSQVTGPITETWTVAQGSLRGTIYYETYDSLLAGGLGSVGIMKIKPGAAKPQVLRTGCGNVCHTASADGSTLVAAQSPVSSASYDLTNNAAQLSVLNGYGFVYAGLYPDGSFVVSATNYRMWLMNPSRLYKTADGTSIPTPSWDSVITNAGTPAFSPDGKQIVFNHEDLDASGAGHTLAAMDYDHTSNTFSNLHDIASDSALALGWPAFTPDGKWVVYHAGSSPQFETDSGSVADLFFTSASGPMVTRLDALDGYKPGGTSTYLPANDPKLNFAPTVLPVAVGGYYWVVFTSHRSYGNMLPSQDGPSGTPDEYGKLWVAAFDINAAPGKDPSHPAFYLDGQELHADNLRGFWVLDPCMQAGNGCTSGDQCCTGYCRAGDGGGTQCVSPPGTCSNEYEKCKAAADCCDPQYACINGFCAQPAAK
jgi:hypothetical protein